MIVLETNVLSALMRQVPEAPVVAWLDRQPSESVWITSITLFEARLGLALLPKGRRRQSLESAFARLLEEDLEDRVLAFDSAAASEAATLAADRQRPGGRWTCATPRSRASPSRGAPRLRPGTCGTFATSKSRSSIPGRPSSARRAAPLRRRTRRANCASRRAVESRRW